MPSSSPCTHDAIAIEERNVPGAAEEYSGAVGEQERRAPPDLRQSLRCPASRRDAEIAGRRREHDPVVGPPVRRVRIHALYQRDRAAAGYRNLHQFACRVTEGHDPAAIRGEVQHDAVLGPGDFPELHVTVDVSRSVSPSMKGMT